MAKYIIFDAGTLINLSQNGLLEAFKELSKIFQGEFLITPTVKYESIDHPLKIKRFEWGAVRIQHLLEENIIKLITDTDLASLEDLNKQTQNVLDTVNGSFSSGSKNIHLIERGEAECLALSIILNIAEGSAKQSDREFGQYLQRSLGSTSEVVACLDIMRDLNMMTERIYRLYLAKCDKIARQLGGFLSPELGTMEHPKCSRQLPSKAPPGCLGREQVP